MKVNWYRRYLYERYQELKFLRKSISDEKIDFTIQQIETFFCDVEPDSLEPISLEELILFEYQSLNHDKIVWNDIKNFHLTSKSIDYNPELLDISLSNSELLELTHDFYKNATTKKIFNNFLHFFNNRHNHIGIFRNCDADIYGDTLYLPYYKEAFIQVFPKDMFIDAAVLAHEYGHAIYDLNNFHPKMRRENYTFLEIISTFFEYLFFLYYTHNGNFKQHALHSLIDTYIERKEQSEELYSFMQLIEYMNLPNYHSAQEEIAAIADFFKIYGYGNIEELFEQGNISSDIVYVFATSIVIELICIYYIDPDKAFYLLNKIMTINPSLSQEEYYQEIINLGIIPNENINTFNNHLKRELTLQK